MVEKTKKEKEKDNMDNWKLEGSKKIMWDRIQELELRVEELENGS